MTLSEIAVRWTPIERVLNIVIGIVGLVTLLRELWKADSTPAAVVNLGIVVFLLTAFALYSFLLSRKERYADITAHIEDVSDRCRKARSRIRTSDDLLEEGSKFRDDLEVILTDIATIFSMLTGTKCRAALKTFRPLRVQNPGQTGGKSEWYCVTLARDHASAAAFVFGDRRRAAEKFDTLDKNPHLLSLFSDHIDGEDWEIFNDIPKMICDLRYASSTLLWEMKQSHSHSGGHHEHSVRYKSAMTALIRNKTGEAVAFIGIDSSASRVFRVRSDGALLAALGGYIGPLLDDALRALGVNSGTGTRTPPAATAEKLAQAPLLTQAPQPTAGKAPATSTNFAGSPEFDSDTQKPQ